jgi:CBS domain-containing protein
MENVADILNHKGRDVWNIRPDEPVERALADITEKNIGALLVLDEKENPVGIFTERDFTRYCAVHEKIDLQIPVGDVMNKEVVCIREDQTVENCMILMTEKRIRHLPVIHDKKVIGMVSIGDVVNACIHEKELLIDQLEHYITGSLY